MLDVSCKSESVASFALQQSDQKKEAQLSLLTAAQSCMQRCLQSALTVVQWRYSRQRLISSSNAAPWHSACRNTGCLLRMQTVDSHMRPMCPLTEEQKPCPDRVRLLTSSLKNQLYTRISDATVIYTAMCEQNKFCMPLENRCAPRFQQ